MFEPTPGRCVLHGRPCLVVLGYPSTCSNWGLFHQPSFRPAKCHQPSHRVSSVKQAALPAGLGGVILPQRLGPHGPFVITSSALSVDVAKAWVSALWLLHSPVHPTRDPVEVPGPIRVHRHVFTCTQASLWQRGFEVEPSGLALNPDSATYWLCNFALCLSFPSEVGTMTEPTLWSGLVSWVAIQSTTD